MYEYCAIINGVLQGLGLSAHLLGEDRALTAKGDLRKEHPHGGGGPGITLPNAGAGCCTCCNSDHL